jgi:uncharacterized protein (TIGR02996 family)
MGEYLQAAQSDAWDTLSEFVDEMVERWKLNGKVSDDLNNDYSGGDEYHHSNHVDKHYRLTEALALLDELSEYEEDDDGLWQGLEPRRAIAVQAAYTYGNAVYGEWRSLVEELNNHLDDLKNDMDDASEAAVEAAGERFIRLHVELGSWDKLPGDQRTLSSAAWYGAVTGDRTGALVLADWYQEHDDEQRANRIRAAVSAEAEEEPDTAA